MKILQIEGTLAHVEAAGIELDVSLDLVDSAGVGDYVIVHAGYAITRLPEEEALETLEILRRIQVEATDG